MDIISDMITRIRNGLMAEKEEVSIVHSKQNVGILSVLEREGYIKSFKEEEIRTGVKLINVVLKYYNGSPTITSIARVSKSSRRLYTGINDLKLVNNGLGVSILTTSKGILSDSEARSQNVGGEVICSVF
jgi:small subunit ribosomal protein S8